MRTTDFSWYKENLNSLHEKYGDKFIAIKDKQVIGSFDSYADGVKMTSQKEPLGSFIVQKCGADESAYTCTISSMNFMG